jgi:hypothetical protein
VRIAELERRIADARGEAPPEDRVRELRPKKGPSTAGG